MNASSADNKNADEHKVDIQNKKMKEIIRYIGNYNQRSSFNSSSTCTSKWKMQGQTSKDRSHFQIRVFPFDKQAVITRCMHVAVEYQDRGKPNLHVVCYNPHLVQKYAYLKQTLSDERKQKQK